MDYQTKNKLLQKQALADPATKDIAMHFNEMTVEADTTIYDLSYTNYNGIPVRRETWAWDGIQGSTTPFLTKDVEAMSDEQLLSLTKAHEPVSEPTTLNREQTYTLINHSFVT